MVENISINFSHTRIPCVHAANRSSNTHTYKKLCRVIRHTTAHHHGRFLDTHTHTRSHIEQSSTSHMKYDRAHSRIEKVRSTRYTFYVCTVPRAHDSGNIAIVCAGAIRHSGAQTRGDENPNTHTHTHAHTRTAHKTHRERIQVARNGNGRRRALTMRSCDLVFYSSSV